MLLAMGCGEASEIGIDENDRIGSESGELNGTLLAGFRCRIRRLLGRDCENVCPTIVAFYARPFQDGADSTKVRVVAVDVDGGPEVLNTTLIASNGTLADPNARKTIFTCAEGGEATITATADDADAACDVTRTITVECPGEASLCTGVDCNDGNECTDDSCDPATGQCESVPGAPNRECDFDGLPGLCSDGLCEDAMLCSGIVCDDDNECTNDTCDPLEGQCESNSVNDGVTCDFGGTPGVCMSGVCEDADPCAGVICDDNNECTDDSCNPLNGACETTPVGSETECDFGGFPGLCSGGVCQDAMLCSGVVCDDDNECADEACNPLSGACDFTVVPNGSACDFAGLPGLCEGGVCRDAALCDNIDCDDGNECTGEACQPDSGTCDTTNVTDGTACDFGGLPGLCSTGVCEDAMLCDAVNCNDGNACTDDSCDPFDGECVAVSVTDGTACDFGGFPGLCMTGVCEDAMLCSGVSCDTEDPCTVGSCDPQDGQCSESNVPDGTSCNGNGSCTAGTCVVPADPDPKTGSQTLVCNVLGQTPMVPLNLTVDPAAEFTAGASTSVTTVVDFTIPVGIGDFLIGLGQDTVTVDAATVQVSVNGGTPTPIQLFAGGFAIDVDPDDDGNADPLPLATEVDVTDITNDGSPTVDFVIAGFTVELSDVPLIQRFTLSSDDSCTLSAPVPPVFFPAN